MGIRRFLEGFEKLLAEVICHHILPQSGEEVPDAPFISFSSNVYLLAVMLIVGFFCGEVAAAKPSCPVRFLNLSCYRELIQNIAP